MKNEKVLSNIKDEKLIKKRRDQMVKSSIALFKEKGYHRTTTREIAKASGFSIGTLYEYIRTKEDILFLTCDAIYDKVQEQVQYAFDVEHPSIDNLKKVIRSYFYLMDDLQEEILILYQEVKSLNKESRKYVLQKEQDMVAMLEKVLLNCLPQGFSEKEAKLIANNLFIGGHMWGFRRWILQKEFTLEEYCDLQINLLLKALPIGNEK